MPHFIKYILISTVVLGQVIGQAAEIKSRGSSSALKLVRTELRRSESCQYEPLTASNIYKLELPLQGIGNAREAFAVHWRGDYGCSGGSGAIQEWITLVAISNGQARMVGRITRTVPELAVIDKITVARQGQITAEGWAVGPNDGLFEASQYERVLLRLGDNQWELVSRTVLSRQRSATESQ